MSRWLIWIVSPHTGDKKDCIAEYSNRGHAIAALRGFNKRAWLASSEMQYRIERG